MSALTRSELEMAYDVLPGNEADALARREFSENMRRRGLTALQGAREDLMVAMALCFDRQIGAREWLEERRAAKGTRRFNEIEGSARLIVRRYLSSRQLVTRCRERIAECEAAEAERGPLAARVMRRAEDARALINLSAAAE